MPSSGRREASKAAAEAPPEACRREGRCISVESTHNTLETLENKLDEACEGDVHSVIKTASGAPSLMVETDAKTVPPSLEDSLAAAVGEAARAGRWDVVAQLARELEARRLASSGVVALDERRTKPR